MNVVEVALLATVAMVFVSAEAAASYRHPARLIAWEWLGLFVAFFVVRRHGNTTIEPQGEFGVEVETESGLVSERRVWVCRDHERVLEARLVRVRLKQATGTARSWAGSANG